MRGVGRRVQAASTELAREPQDAPRGRGGLPSAALAAAKLALLRPHSLCPSRSVVGM